MGAVRKLDVEVSEELAGDIDAAVASGDYRSASDVMAQALHAWKRKRDAVIAELREAWRIGIESGEPQPVPDDWAEQVIARGEARLAARREHG